MNYSDLKGKVFAILGATGGIGSALTQELTQRGARLILGSRNGENLQHLADKHDQVFQSLDATKVNEVEAWVVEAKERWGRLDGMVNAVGSVFLKPAHLTSEEEYLKCLHTNLTSAFATVRAAAKVLGREGGSIVLISSAASRIGLANHEAVAAAKGGINGLILAAAATYAAKGIRVNGVCPGLIQTPATQSLTQNEMQRDASTAMHALGRLGDSEDVVSAIAWLLDPMQKFVTGQLLGVDGGLGSIQPKMRRR